MNFQRGAAPGFVEAPVVRLHSEQDGTDFIVSCGDKNQIVHHHRAHRVDRFLDARAEPETGVHVSVGRIQRNQSLSHQTKDLPLAVDRRGYRCRIAGLFVPAFPAHFRFARPAGHRHSLPVLFTDVFPDRFSSPGIERDHAGVGLAADHYDQQVAFEDRRTADAEERGRHFKLLCCIALPDQIAGLQFQADQFALRAERVTAVDGEQRSAARPVIITVGINELAGIAIAPKRFAACGLKAFDHFLISHAMMKHHSFGAHGRRAVPGADFFLPHDRQAVGGPALKQAGFIGNAVAVRAEELRPVFIWFVFRQATGHTQECAARPDQDF